MAKPASVPRWANVGAAVVEPSSGKKDVGWVAGERPPAQYQNWLQLWTYNWCEWLNSTMESEAFTWTGAHIFSAAVTLPANTLVNHGDRVLTQHLLDGEFGDWVLGTFAGGGLSIESTTNQAIKRSIRLHEGDKITSVSFGLSGDGVADLDVTISLQKADGSATIINPGGTPTTFTNPGAFSVQTINVTDTTLAANESILVSFVPSAAGIELGCMNTTYDRP